MVAILKKAKIDLTTLNYLHKLMLKEVSEGLEAISSDDPTIKRKGEMALHKTKTRLEMLLNR